MKKVVVLGTLVLTLTSMTMSTKAGERVSLGYIYSASKSHTQIVEATNGGVNVVSPTTFDLNEDGTLQVNQIADEEFVVNMHAKGIKVTPFLSNHWGRKRAEAALDNPERLVNELVEAIEIYDYDGVNVDLENLAMSYQDKLTEFVKLLRHSLPKEKIVSVAVAANPERLTSSWVAVYDNKELAKYADYLVLMAYDEHSYGGAEGPVASIGFVEKAIKVALEEVSRDKLVLGMPLYGRVWQEGKDVGGEAVIMAQMPRILKKYKLVPKYDIETQTPQIILTIESGDKGPYVDGNYLEEGIYHIYFENENSMKAKLALVNQYDILGGALWALSNESLDLWNYYYDELNAVPYESDKEIRLREKYEYAVKNLVGEPEIAMIAVGTIDLAEEVSIERKEQRNEEILAKTEKVEEDLMEDMHVVKKNKNYKIIRKMVRMKKEFENWKKNLTKMFMNRENSESILLFQRKVFNN